MILIIVHKWAREEMSASYTLNISEYHFSGEQLEEELYHPAATFS